MPRPSSVTVTELSGFRVTVTRVGMAGQRLVDGVVDDLVDHVMEAGAIVRIADVHARTLPDGVETTQDLDRIGAVVFGLRSIGIAGCVIIHAV